MKLKKPAVLALAAMLNANWTPAARASNNDALVAGVLAGTTVLAGMALYKSIRNTDEIVRVKIRAMQDRKVTTDGLVGTNARLNARIDALLKELRGGRITPNDEPAPTAETAAEASPEPLVSVRIIMVENNTGEDVTLKNIVPMGSMQEKFTWLIPASRGPQPVIIGVNMSTDQLFAVDKDEKPLTIDVDHETKSRIVISPAS